MMCEEWKDIAISDGEYQISNFGRVKSVERTTGNGRAVHERILKTRFNKKGYEYVCIQKNKKRKAIKIHREVAKAFLENPNNCEQVNHKDEDKTNNTVWNLEWCDHKYNLSYGTGRNRAAASRSSNHVMEIDQFTVDGIFLKRWRSPAAVERETGKAMRATNIIACCRGKYKKSYGFVWKYANKTRIG